MQRFQAHALVLASALAGMLVAGCLGGVGGGGPIGNDDNADTGADGADDSTGGTDSTDGADDSTDGTDDGSDDGGPPIEGEPAELAGITAAHNALRAEVGVAAMTWSEDLEALAMSLFGDSNCVMQHSSQGARSNVAGFSYVGENLYWSGGFQPTGADVSDAWGSEKADYDYASNGCSGVCGHYTQQVWETSTALGCAMVSCGNEHLVACEYGPGGNYQGQRPY